jgi:hypothetical protein
VEPCAGERRAQLGAQFIESGGRTDARARARDRRADPGAGLEATEGGEGGLSIRGVNRENRADGLVPTILQAKLAAGIEADAQRCLKIARAPVEQELFADVGGTVDTRSASGIERTRGFDEIRGGRAGRVLVAGSRLVRDRGEDGLIG